MYLAILLLILGNCVCERTIIVESSEAFKLGGKLTLAKQMLEGREA